MIPSAVSCRSRSERLAERADRALGRVAVEVDPARDLPEQAEQQVGVGHRRLLAAVAVGGGAGARARRSRPDAQRAARVAPGDRAAAGADRVDVEHRQRDRAAADLAPGGLAHLAVEDDADVAARAAHVEAQRVGLPRGVRGPGGAGGAARGAGEHGQHGVVGGLLERGQAAAGLHHRGLRQSGLTRAVGEAAQIGGEQGGERGVELGGRGALVLPEGADDLVAEADVDAGKRARERFAEGLLVLRVAVGVQEADGDGLGLERLDGARPPRRRRVRAPGRPASSARSAPTRRSGGTSGAGRPTHSR